MRYRRSQTRGGTFFFTVVTHKRRPFLCLPDSIPLLRTSFGKVKAAHPFHIDAIVVLPDHLHCIWTMPDGDADYARRWRQIKSMFSRQCEKECRGEIASSRRSKKEQAVWQRRFWEHRILDDRDFQQHVEYIHYNPVKHGLVDAPGQWSFSSFHKYVGAGHYAKDWGENQVPDSKETTGRE